MNEGQDRLPSSLPGMLPNNPGQVQGKKALARAAGGAAALFGLSFALVACLTDGPFLTLSPREGRSRRAALAIRDPEKPFMQWGTRLFTAPTLSRHYGRAYCFTQSSKEDQREEIQAALEEALLDYDAVDIFLLAHSNRYHEWVAEMDETLRSQKLRLVYNTGCYNAKQGDIWLKLGAKTYIGHPGSSFSPPFYVFFTRRWVRGMSSGEAADQANPLAKRLLFRMERAVPSKMDAAKTWENTEAVFFGDPEVSIESPAGAAAKASREPPVRGGAAP